jgi:DNA primase
MAFSPQFLDELRGRLVLADIVSRRVRLTRKGREYSGLCPFHKEKTPSFTLNEDKGFYHCFGCGAHGTVFDFVMQTDGLSFPEAVERLAGEAGMQIPVDTPEEQERVRQRQTLYEVMETACAWFERCLHMPEGKGALSYLQGRGVDDSVIARFRLGFAPDSRGAMKAALARDGISEDLMVGAGLLIRPEDQARQPYDRFRGRAMFPITDRRGRVIAFGGRILGPGEPKYLNSPETPLFHKGQTLYALSQATPAARTKGTVIVAEGYMDVIALHRAGFENAVAPLGTALTEDQIRELWRLAREPVLCFDGDAAGQKAAARAAERVLPMLKPGYGLRFAVIPGGDDPDSLIVRDGPAGMEKVVAAAQPLSEVLWRQEVGGRAVNTPEDRAWLEEKLKSHAVRIADPTVRSHFLNAFRDRLWRELRGARGVTGRKSRTRPTLGGINVAAASGARVNQTHEAQKKLVAIIVNHPWILPRVEEQLGTVACEDPGLDELRQELLALLADDPEMEGPEVVATLRQRGFARQVDALLSDPTIVFLRSIAPDAPEADVQAVWESNLRLLQGVADKIARAGTPPSEDLSGEEWQRMQAQLKASFDDDDE